MVMISSVAGRQVRWPTLWAPVSLALLLLGLLLLNIGIPLPTSG